MLLACNIHYFFEVLNTPLKNEDIISKKFNSKIESVL